MGQSDRGRRFRLVFFVLDVGVIRPVIVDVLDGLVHRAITVRFEHEVQLRGEEAEEERGEGKERREA